MDKIIISNEASEEFKTFLDENDIHDYKIRIEFAGLACSGPSFNIAEGVKEEDDIVQEINGITFYVKPSIIDEYGLLTILSTEENEGRGMTLRPLLEIEGGCSGCSGCH
ncbi:HesB-like protein [Candidatus Clostridium radicumherbarum]|uniref:HesB-like protein n=1 Tax=Candidatus Clostridium radicumherbarum TaxID=3381662 RepID=A0ABW8TWF7_9CLOT